MVRPTPKGLIPVPLIPVKIQYKNSKPVDTLLLLDSGADFSMIPRNFAEGLGIDCERLPVTSTSGVGGECKVGETAVYISFGQRGENYEFKIPVQIPLDPKIQIVPLLGRIPLFYEFDISFRMGYCEDKGKFTLKKVIKRHDGKKYSKTPLWG